MMVPLYLAPVFSDFGLGMHFGSKGAARKTECVFYPVSEWLNNTQLTPNTNTNTSLQIEQE